jgi:hypothetical protein
MTSKVAAWLEIAGGVALAIAAEPIHEIGHAVAARVLTGSWPRVGLWAVHPTARIQSVESVLGILAAGDLAVIAWWGLAALLAWRHRHRRWMLIGPTFMAGLALLNWFASAVLAPFGHSDWGATDAAKFITISGVAWQQLAACIAVAASAVVVATVKCLSPVKPT